MPAEDVPDDGTSPTRQIRRQERFDRLEAAIERLSDDHREVIKMTRIDGIPVREVAERMHRSEKATYQLLWRATSKLKEVFGDTKSFRLPADRNLGGTASRSSTCVPRPAASSFARSAAYSCVARPFDAAATPAVETPGIMAERPKITWRRVGLEARTVIGNTPISRISRS